MSTNSSLKTIQDGLVFYFDANNPKSYIGEPTTNLNKARSDYTGTSYSTDGEWTSNPTVFTKTYYPNVDTPIGNGATYCVESGTTGYHHLSTWGGSGESGAHSISCYVYPISNNISNFTIGMLNDGGNMVTFDFTTNTITYGGSISNRNAIMQPLKDWPGWYRVGANIEGRVGGWVGSIGLNVNTSYTPSSPYKSFYITGVQYEYKDHITQYVTGSRSNTDGAIDLAKTNSINLSNTAFDSNARITFNNSTSYINTGCILNGSTYTKFAWFNTNNLSAANNIVSGGTNGQHAFWLAVGNKLNAGHNGSWSTVQSSTTISTNTWYFGAASFSTSTGWRLYLNGSMEASSVSTTTFTGTTMPTLIGSYDYGNLFSGTIDMVGIYNKVLSDADVLQLYLRTKSRYRL